MVGSVIMKKIFVLALVLTIPTIAQQPSSTTAAHIFYGPSLPATCRTATGDVFFKTTSTIQPYYCSSANTWTAIGSSGGGGGVVNPSSYTVTAQTQVTLSATGTSVNVSPTTAHGMGVYAKPACFNSVTPKRAYDCDYTLDASGNIVIDFSPAFTGVVQVGPGGGFVPGSGNPAGATNTVQYNAGSSTFGAVTLDNTTTHALFATAGVPAFRAIAAGDVPFSAPGAIGGGTPSTGAFTTLSATGQITSTLSTGTAPFSVASTTVVSNLNVSALLGSTWANPTAIGTGTPASGAFTTLSATGQITSTLSTGTAPFTVASTTVVANLNASALGGATFAAPGTIGGGTPAAATFTNLTASGATVVLSGLGAASGTPDSVCLNTNTVVRNAALTCTVSSENVKNSFGAIPASMNDFMSLRPMRFEYNAVPGRVRWGFGAQQVASVNPALADGWRADGQPWSLDQNAILALTVKTVQELRSEIVELKKQLSMK